MPSKPGDIIVCIVNKRSAYSYLPRLIPGEKYTILSKLIIRTIEHYQLNEHPGFYFPFDHFENFNEIRNKKLNKLNKLNKI